jgi:hypothetical protein
MPGFHYGSSLCAYVQFNHRCMSGRDFPCGGAHGVRKKRPGQSLRQKKRQPFSPRRVRRPKGRLHFTRYCGHFPGAGRGPQSMNNSPCRGCPTAPPPQGKSLPLLRRMGQIRGVGGRLVTARLEPRGGQKKCVRGEKMPGKWPPPFPLDQPVFSPRYNMPCLRPVPVLY